MRTLPTLLGLALCVSVTATPCDPVKGTGEVVKRTITVDAIHGIKVMGSMDVILTQAATQSIEIEAQANIADLVSTTVRNGIWYLDTEKSYSTNKDFIVRISVPNIDLVHIDGSGDVKAMSRFTGDDVELGIAGSGDMTMEYAAKNIEASISGSGTIRLSGECTALKAAIAGSGDVIATKLNAARADAAIAGSGDISLTALESLHASIAGSGNVTYKGKPTAIHKDVVGSGEVRTMESSAY
ncbi:MAG: DUF2807 domain-containing protein [Flavobacteriales bacterium]|nr:DUF2807 domain-containing protein [Flavobacteriales bacterium]MBP6698199.1 DUF2807 domain-containing protein [Flavobacteriales bacterium]